MRKCTLYLPRSPTDDCVSRNVASAEMSRLQYDSHECSFLSVIARRYPRSADRELTRLAPPSCRRLQGGYPGAFQSPPAPMSPGGGYPPQQQGGYPQPGFPGGPAAMPMVPMQQPMMQPMMAAPAAPGLPMQQVMQPMMQPVAMVPPGYALVPAGSVVQQLVGNDLLSAIGGLKGLFISQEVSLTEVLTGCDTQNKYGATAWNPALGAERPKDGKYGEQVST